jgi:SAM-dependent methyltransferase
MIQDKSQLYYGRIYHSLLDPQLAEARQVAVKLIPEGSSVLDIACGTGQLCFALREQKGCRVIGIDLSVRMLEFARKSNRFQDISFVHEDATDLSAFKDHSFDYVTILFLLHELPMPQQTLVVKEALRVANKVIIIDSVSPLPRNLGGIAIRIVEAIIGHDHYPNFKAFLAAGGIRGMVQKFTPSLKLEYSSLFWRNCREVIVVCTQS